MDFNSVPNLGTISLVHCSLTLSAGAVLRGGFSVVSLVPYRMDMAARQQNSKHVSRDYPSVS